eukprot:gene8765-biopygen6743
MGKSEKVRKKSGEVRNGAGAGSPMTRAGACDGRAEAARAAGAAEANVRADLRRSHPGGEQLRDLRAQPRRADDHLTHRRHRGQRWISDSFQAMKMDQPAGESGWNITLT